MITTDAGVFCSNAAPKHVIHLIRSDVLAPTVHSLDTTNRLLSTFSTLLNKLVKENVTFFYIIAYLISICKRCEKKKIYGKTIA